jgi:hypothetical protein
MSKHKIFFSNPNYHLKIFDDEIKFSEFKKTQKHIKGIYGINVRHIIFRYNLNHQLEIIHRYFKQPIYCIPNNCIKIWVVMYADILLTGLNRKFQIYLSRLLLHRPSLDFCEYQLLARHVKLATESKTFIDYKNKHDDLDVVEQEHLMLFGDAVSMILGIGKCDILNVIHYKFPGSLDYFNNCNIVDLHRISSENKMNATLISTCIDDSENNYKCIYYLGLKISPLYNFIYQRKIECTPKSFAELYFIKYNLPKLYVDFDAYVYGIPVYTMKYDGKDYEGYRDYITDREYIFLIHVDVSDKDKKLIRTLKYRWLIGRTKVDRKAYSVKIYEKLYLDYEFSGGIIIPELEN